MPDGQLTGSHLFGAPAIGTFQQRGVVSQQPLDPAIHLLVAGDKLVAFTRVMRYIGAEDRHLGACADLKL